MRNCRIEAGNNEAGDQRGTQVGDQPAYARPIGIANRFVDVAFASAAHQQGVFARFLGDDVNDIVDGQLAHQPSAVIDHGGADQRVFLESQRHLFLIHVGRDQRLVALHHVKQRDVARRAQNPRKLAGADRVEAMVDNENLEEFGDQVIVVAQIVDQVADGHRFWHRHQLALHQATGGFLRVRQRILDRCAIFRSHFGEDRALIDLGQILDQLHRVVGVELLCDLRDGRCGQRLDHAFTDVIVEFGNDLRIHQIGDRGGQNAPLVGFEQLQQIGNVGRVQGFDQIVGEAKILLCQRLANGADEFWLQPVLLVELVSLVTRSLFACGLAEIGFGHVCALLRNEAKASVHGIAGA